MTDLIPNLKAVLHVRRKRKHKYKDVYISD